MKFLTESGQVATSEAPVELATLLLVGDPAALSVAREALIELELGWQVVFAGSAFDAHDIPAVRPPDVILIDLGNPHIEGVDLVESLHTSFPHVPIVLMSAPFAVRDALEGMRKGAVNHFPRELLDSEPTAVLDALRQAALNKSRSAASRQCLDRVSYDFILPNDRAFVPPIVARLQGAVVDAGLCDRTAATRVGVALEEAMVNAIVHGNLEVSSDLRQDGEDAYERAVAVRQQQLPFCTRKVTVRAKVSASEAIFVIEDEGPGFDAAAVPDPTASENLFRVGGRGLLLMRSFMTTVQYNARGNQVTLVKRRV